MNNIEELMAELAKSSVDLKKKLYRRDEAASTSPQGTEGPCIEVHTCRVCDRSAAGKGAEVRHQPECALVRLQKAQKDLRGAWPELFARKATPEEGAPGARTHPNGTRRGSTNARVAADAPPPPPAPQAGIVRVSRGRG
jgi:hypothetical protein